MRVRPVDEIPIQLTLSQADCEAYCSDDYIMDYPHLHQCQPCFIRSEAGIILQVLAAILSSQQGNYAYFADLRISYSVATKYTVGRLLIIKPILINVICACYLTYMVGFRYGFCVHFRIQC